MPLLPMGQQSKNYSQQVNVSTQKKHADSHYLKRPDRAVVSTVSLPNTSDIIYRFWGFSSLSCHEISTRVLRSMDGRHLSHSSSNVFPQDRKSAWIAL